VLIIELYLYKETQEVLLELFHLNYCIRVYPKEMCIEEIERRQWEYKMWHEIKDWDDAIWKVWIWNHYKADKRRTQHSICKKTCICI